MSTLYCQLEHCKDAKTGVSADGTCVFKSVDSEACLQPNLKMPCLLPHDSYCLSAFPPPHSNDGLEAGTTASHLTFGACYFPPSSFQALKTSYSLPTTVLILPFNACGMLLYYRQRHESVGCQPCFWHQGFHEYWRERGTRLC